MSNDVSSQVAPAVQDVAFGKYGLPITDECVIEALAGCLERLRTPQRLGPERESADGQRLRHALAAYLIRAITPRDEIWRDLPTLSPASPDA